ncbi:MAG: YaiI/YqxD family protein [Pseudomonadota bacterium]
MTKLYIDADACPVKAEAIEIATRHGVEVLLVSNGGIRPPPEPHVSIVVVPEGPDEADRWIAERAGRGDVVVTTDIPLAARAVEGGARVVKPDGETLTDANIGPALAMRDLMADLRAANPLGQGGGGKAFGRGERSRFRDTLDRTLRAACRDLGTPDR